MAEIAFFSAEGTDLMRALDAVLRTPRSLPQLYLAAGAENLRRIGHILARELARSATIS